MNTLWNPAWNVVVVILTDNNADTVLYGYAFRDHWMWYNGYLMADGKFVAFIIWKDYNCAKWWSYDANAVGGPTNSTLSNDVYFKSNYTGMSWLYSVSGNVWMTTFNMVTQMQSQMRATYSYIGS